MGKIQDSKKLDDYKIYIWIDEADKTICETTKEIKTWHDGNGTGNNGLQLKMVQKIYLITATTRKLFDKFNKTLNIIQLEQRFNDNYLCLTDHCHVVNDHPYGEMVAPSYILGCLLI